MISKLNTRQRVAMDLMNLVGATETFTALLNERGDIWVMRPGTKDAHLVFLSLDDFNELEAMGAIAAESRVDGGNGLPGYASTFRLQVD